MTTYRLWPAANGGALASFSGSFIAGTTFQVAPGVMWLQGYWWWVPTGGDTTPVKCALWVETTNSTGSVVSGSVVTSGTLSATPTGSESGGHWNFIPLASPPPLAPGTAYIAAIGWTAVHGFPDTNLYWGSGAGTNGIANGPLLAFSSASSGGTSNKAPYAGGQGVFTTAGADPSVTEPLSQSGSDNFWVDVQVSDTAPAGYAGSYRLWPNNTAANTVTVTDAAVNYDVATEFALSQPCTLNKIWYFSPSGVTQLATAANIWSITAPGTTGTLVATNSSPSWSGAAGSGWVSCSFTGVTLPAGKYKVSVYNGAATPSGWNAKDANTDYWRNGAGASGIASGPLSAPNLAGASLAFNYNGNAGGTPPFSDGTTLAGQPTFTQGPPDSYPYLYAPVATPAAGSTQNYWVDVEVTPLAPDASEPPQVPQPLLDELLASAAKRWSTDAPAGSPASVSGAVAQLTLAAPAGTVQAGASVAGTPAALALSAPAGSVSAGASASGVPAALALGAPAGSPSAGATITGTTAALAFAAPAGTASAGTSVTGTVAALTLAAPAGTVSASAGAAGSPAALILAAPTGAVSTGTAATGIPALLTLTAPAGSMSAGAVITGAVSALTLVAPAGTVVTGTGIPGLTAGLTLAALPGTVTAGAAVAGVPAVLTLAAPGGTPPSLAPLFLTASTAATGTLTAGDQKAGGPS